MEGIASKVPPLENKILELQRQRKEYRLQNLNLQQQVDSLHANTKTFEVIEWEYRQRIADLNMEKTNQAIKLKNSRRNTWIAIGVGGGISAILGAVLIGVLN